MATQWLNAEKDAGGMMRVWAQSVDVDSTRTMNGFYETKAIYFASDMLCRLHRLRKWPIFCCAVVLFSNVVVAVRQRNIGY